MKGKGSSEENKKGHNPRTDRKPKQMAKGSLNAIFRHQQSDIAVDIVKADCMNHGYRLEKSIGEGAYAKVKLAEVLPSKLARNQTLADIADETDVLNVAIKVVENKRVPKEFLMKFLPRELQNHVPLPPHPYVVRVYEQFATTERVYVVMEYCSKGDLLDLINQRISDSCKGIGEELARKLFKQTCLGVHHIHSNEIAHRDLKCENILLDDNSDAKITDFGFSCKFNDSSKFLKTSCGSYAYTAPEVIQSKAYDGFRSDTWSLGIILFAMLNGRLPFNDSQLLEMDEDMKMQRLRFERTVSFESMVLVRKILQYNPVQRPTLSEILNDPWITGKRPIPRQMNKPVWANSYQIKKEDGKKPGSGKISDTSNVYFKATITDRSADTTVTLNYDSMEKVTLKSRRPKHKNIWSTGPNNPSNRPNTWPRSEKEATKKAPGGKLYKSQYRQSDKAMCTSVRPPGTPRQEYEKSKKPESVKERQNSAKSIRLSKWFMDQYMRSYPPEEDGGGSGVSKQCRLPGYICKTEERSRGHVDKAVVPETEDSSCHKSPIKQTKSPPVGEPTHNTLRKSAKSSTDGHHYSSPQYHSGGIDPEIEKSRWQSARNEAEYTSGDNAGIAKPSNTRTPAPKSAVTKEHSKVDGHVPIASRSADLGNYYLANRSTSPLQRVKFFRDRLLKMYGQDSKPSKDGDQLPPLLVQSLSPKRAPTPSRSPTISSKTSPSNSVHNSSKGATSSSGYTVKHKTRGANSGARKWFLQSTPIKPVQKVIVHT